MMRKTKLLLLAIILLLVSCTTYNEKLVLGKLENGDADAMDKYYDAVNDNEVYMIHIPDDNNGGEYFEASLSFDNTTGSVFNSNVFNVLESSDSMYLFISKDMGGHGWGLFYLDFGARDGYLHRMEFDFTHSIPTYILIDGVSTLRYVDASPNIARGFYMLGGEYFFITGEWTPVSFGAGAIGRLIRTTTISYNDAGYSVFRNEWHIEKHLTLPGSPHVFLLNGENLYIATANQILLVNGDEVTILAYDVMFGSNSTPNAIDKIGDTLFIRTRDGVWSYNVEMDILEFSPN